MKIHEVIVSAVLPMIKGVGKLEMHNVLTSIKENNTPEVYKSMLQGLSANFSLLKEAAAKTRSHFDDGIVDLILEAVHESAEAEGWALA